MNRFSDRFPQPVRTVGESMKNFPTREVMVGLAVLTVAVAAVTTTVAM